ncbi:MAG TPA: hypothetical protein VGF55_26935 [Gemmataceae bacterium]
MVRAPRLDERTREHLVFALLDELGPEAINLVDRFLFKTAAGEDAASGEDT